MCVCEWKRGGILNGYKSLKQKNEEMLQQIKEKSEKWFAQQNIIIIIITTARLRWPHGNELIGNVMCTNLLLISPNENTKMLAKMSPNVRN